MNEAAVLGGLTGVVGALWQMTLAQDENLYSAREYVALMDYVLGNYPNAGTKFGLFFPLNAALESLGVKLPVSPAHPAPPPGEVARALHNALLATSVRRVYLCPLDWADNPPPVQYGPNTMRVFSASELQELFDAQLLERVYPNSNPRWVELARFHWLAIEETKSLDKSPGERANPFFFQPLDRDLGAFDPHRGKYPAAVEEALFFLLLAPWEDWAESIEASWRGFEVPWVYTADRDLFIRPESPPDHTSLTWEPVAFTDAYTGETFETERPAHFRLADASNGLPTLVNHDTWDAWQAAKETAVFAPPVVHFMVRAFLANDVDEFMAHMSAIEAALGLHSDYQNQRDSTHPKLSPTDRIVRRIGALVGEPTAGDQYRVLFGVRSEYVHGRPMATISSDHQATARRLARTVVVKLVEVAGQGRKGVDRDAYLMSLLGQPEGVKLTLDQAEQVANLINQQNQLSKPYSAAMVMGGDYLMEVDAAGNVIACAEVKSVQWYQAEVCHVSVDSDHKRKGLASKLVARAADRAEQLGARVLQCTIRQGNKESEGLFAKMGFAQGPAFYNAKTKNNVAIWTKVLRPAK